MAVCNAIFRRLPAFPPSAFCFLPTYHKTMPREVYYYKGLKNYVKPVIFSGNFLYSFLFLYIFKD
jgi:hypothetical protein